MATAGYTGFLLGPPLIGGIAEITSLRAALGVLALFGVVIVLLFGVSDCVVPGVSAPTGGIARRIRGASFLKALVDVDHGR